jgi:hypothetical protein
VSLEAVLTWLSRLGLSEWLTLVSALVAVASFGFNWAVVRRQTAMQFEGLRNARDSDLIKWADEVIEIMANAQKLCRERDKLIAPDEFRRGQSEVRTRLSALLDRGRLFFPNTTGDADQADKEAAFRGERKAALNAVFGVYRIVSDVERETASSDPVRDIVAQKRIFISEVFDTIDPRRRENILSELDYSRAKHRQERARGR